MRRAVTAGVVGALLLLTGACGPVVELRAPDLDTVPRDVPEQSQVLDAQGAVLGVLRREFRERVPLEAVPDHLVDAVVAAEDRRFFTHAGIDARALVRAAVANVTAGGVEQGGSTITQQLVGILYDTEAPDGSAEGKVREMLLARQLEREHDKDWILEEYLNTIYLGAGAYGVKAAAETYWRKPVGDLRLHESALLAGLIRAPESLNPAREPVAARQRRDAVLDTMLGEGMITPGQAASARAAPVEVAPRPPAPSTLEPHWVDFVVRSLLGSAAFGATEEQRAARLYGGGLRIRTTIRPDLQAAAREAIARFLPDPDDPEVALVAVVPQTGEIVAVVGGRDHTRLQFDLATQGRRQAGSTFKTFVLAAAVATGYAPDHRVSGAQGVLPTDSGPWTVRNYDRVSRGMITLEDAIRASVNAAFARLGLEVGIDRVVALAHLMGVTSPLEEHPAVALGGLQGGVSPLDMASAYATLANLGTHVPVSPVARVEDADGRVLWRPDRTPRRALDASAAFVVTRMLEGVVEAGTGQAARLEDRPVAGKTGTVDDHTDAWFVGYTPGLAVAVWIGYPQGRVPLTGVAGVRAVTGGTLPARIWKAFMQQALQGQAPQPFTLPPEHYRVVEIDPATGLRAAAWCPGEERVLPRAIVPRETCPRPPPAPSPAPTPSVATCPDDPTPTRPAAPSPRPQQCATATGPAPGPTGAPSPGR